MVTDSTDNIVRRVDDITFCDYMRNLGISPEQRKNGIDALVQYGPLPCRLGHKQKDDDGIPEIRCISYTNLKEGSVAFSSSLPVGTRVHIGIIHSSDVIDSARDCLGRLTEEMAAQQKDGYRYSLIFSIPCVARYYALLGGENLEGKMMREQGNLALHTYYCEIGPTSGAGGEIHNRSNNASSVMCAI